MIFYNYFQQHVVYCFALWVLLLVRTESDGIALTASGVLKHRAEVELESTMELFSRFKRSISGHQLSPSILTFYDVLSGIDFDRSNVRPSHTISSSGPLRSGPPGCSQVPNGSARVPGRVPTEFRQVRPGSSRVSLGVPRNAVFNSLT